MKRRTPFRHLLELFQGRFFENDAVSPDGGFETNIWQVLGFLASPGDLHHLPRDACNRSKWRSRI